MLHLHHMILFPPISIQILTLLSVPKPKLHKVLLHLQLLQGQGQGEVQVNNHLLQVFWLIIQHQLRVLEIVFNVLNVQRILVGLKI